LSFTKFKGHFKSFFSTLYDKNLFNYWHRKLVGLYGQLVKGSGWRSKGWDMPQFSEKKLKIVFLEYLMTQTKN